ncbi:MAG: hypothetical protein QHH30_11835 [candidate division NC10 bacterium]|nr:hypothetical protein [candidate division NC10 bacterium]
MKGYPILLWIFFLLAGISLIVAVIAKLTHVMFLGGAPIAYIRFTGICLLFCIALSLTQISLKQ